ncbi:CNH domain-containing protein [Mycena rebaudengoi]|nr:CNH domain-containing protein [Mycena rebaudengoi]KAJ7289072.1 CNH domain-containing protein [Mycena rebaudengoi]
MHFTLKSRNGAHRSPWNVLRSAVVSQGLPPFPKSVTDQISTELYEVIIDRLWADKQTLLACSLVCRSWVPRSKHHLLAFQFCRPEHLATHGGLGAVTSAVIYKPHNDLDSGILYSTTDGIYKSSLDARRTQLLRVTNVTQIDVLEAEDLFVGLAGGTLIILPFSTLLADSNPNNIRQVSKHGAFFSVHRNTADASQPSRICVVKTSAHNTTIKIFNVSLGPNNQSVLTISREIYIPRESYSVRLLSQTKLAAAVKGGFEMVDLPTLNTQSLLDFTDPALEFAQKKTKPMAIFRVSDIFLVCYDKFGFYIDRAGRMARNALLIHWKAAPVSFALHEPYLLVFNHLWVDVWNIETGKLMQSVHGGHVLLNSPLSGETILASHDDLDIVELELLQ